MLICFWTIHIQQGDKNVSGSIKAAIPLSNLFFYSLIHGSQKLKNSHKQNWQNPETIDGELNPVKTQQVDPTISIHENLRLEMATLIEILRFRDRDSIPNTCTWTTKNLLALDRAGTIDAKIEIWNIPKWILVWLCEWLRIILFIWPNLVDLPLHHRPEVFSYLLT